MPEYGCVFCRPSLEERVREEILAIHPRIDALIPRRKRIRRRRGVRTEELAKLFPGYVFFAADEDIDAPSLLRESGVNGILRSPGGSWKLDGKDRSLAEYLFSVGGIIDFSRAYFENGRLRVVEGPLKCFEESVVSVNRRARVARVNTSLFGEAVSIWFGFDIVDAAPSQRVSPCRAKPSA